MQGIIEGQRRLQYVKQRQGSSEVVTDKQSEGVPNCYVDLASK